MKLLYFSTHSILEFDEVKLFTELGHEVFSMGAFQNSNLGDSMRGPIPGLYDNPELRELSHQCTKEDIHPKLVEWMDVCIMMHNPPGVKHAQPWLANNWKKMKGKPVVWRSIGQSTRQIEEGIKEFRSKGLKIVRYSPKEESIPEYQGGDAMIRFYKDPNEYTGYLGTTERIVNVSQALFGGREVKSRGDHMSLQLFNKVVTGLPWKVFGPDNENAGENNGGLLSHEDMKQMLRLNRVYFYTGTRPASYTLALIEAMMTGIPIVSVGNAAGNDVYRDQKTFEVPEILGENGVAGYWSDSPTELHDYCDFLLKNPKKALEVGTAGRVRAIELFGKANIAIAWRDFLASL